MYIPKIYEVQNIQPVESYIKKNNFASLTGVVGRRAITSHIPLMLDESSECLLGHVSRANRLANCFDGESELLAVFMHTHAYVSSSWYDHVNVPTWNYIAVHIYGKAVKLTGNALKTSINKLVDHFEEGRPNRFRMEDMDDEMLQAHLNGIVGFRLSIENVEASFKLSQNRHDMDYKEIIRQLEATEDVLSHKVAVAMKKIRNL